MSRCVSRRVRAWAVGWVVAVGCGGLAGCAGSGERLPQCRGRPQPINLVTTAPVSIATSGHGVTPMRADATQERSAIHAH